MPLKGQYPSNAFISRQSRRRRQRHLLIFICHAPSKWLPDLPISFSFTFTENPFFLFGLHEKFGKPNFTNPQKTTHSLISGIDKCIALVNM